MGADSSKPSSEPAQHIFAAEAPVRFSTELVESLQNNPQTDSTRAKNLELQIQSRVTAELERLQALESQRLAELTEKLSSDSDAPASNRSVVDKIADELANESAAAEKQRSQNLSRDSVSKEIAELKRKLAQRKKVEQPDAGVTRAKEALVTCLRTNEHRPLDCWKEVENFKKEISRLEKEFVEKTVRQ